ncbi:hypothetical protein GCM10009786_04830 [Leucobacter alluvii]|uniref:Uncharacterized protein n=2 Tax=Leucobacter TaxID=55968 RepID=A0A1H0YGM6_9MICO|nr:hypothetical protein [Leucobacter chromiiresistens]SDQ14357.1 hypothetical protein SAMN04488565_0859 [Leucobacter chromiiresistens]
MGARSAARRPLSRRALLTLVWVGAFVVLGLAGLRAHSTELASVPVVAEGAASSTTASAAPGDTIVEGGELAAHGSVQSWHLDLLTVCMLSMLATLMLFVLFTRRPWLQQRLGRIRDWAVALPRAPARPQPLLLLHSISRT